MSQLLTSIQWQNLNGLRNYPLEDSATRLSDTGAKLPTDVVTDIHVWAPLAGAGTRLFLGSVGVTAGLVSVTVAADDGGGGFVPVAAVTVPAPIVVGRHYPLNPLIDGAAGWVTFGPGVSKPGNWAFSTPEQAPILHRLTHCYAYADVTSFARAGRTTTRLLGDVLFSSGDPNRLVVEAVPATSPSARTIDGTPRDALVFRLNESGTAGFAVHAEFLGPCLRAPESGSCRRPGIFSVNGVTPDCDGVLHIVIEEVTDDVLGPQLSVTAVDGQVVINFDTPLDTICNRSQAKNEYPVLADPECYSACFFPFIGPFAGYVPQFSSGSLNYGEGP